MSGPLQTLITDRIHSVFPEAIHIEVINESSAHAVPRGSETHFKIVVVCDSFSGQSRLSRHRMIQKAIERESAMVKAISLRPHTPQEWSDMGKVAGPSPNCKGG